MALAQTSRPSHRPTVLVIDDDMFARTMATGRLESLGVELLEAEDGSAAMRLLMQREVDLAIVDLEMPGVDGFGVLGCIRGHPRLQHIPVVVLTGREDIQAMTSALAAGATSFLRKPLNWDAFGEHLRHLIELSGRSSAVRASSS